MDFYTHVHTTRDLILVRGYKGGKQVKAKLPYKPTLYVLSKKDDSPFKTLDGRNLEPIHLDSMGGARRFRDKYSGVDSFEIHGFDRWAYTYIADTFKGDIEYDPKLIRVCTLDIECECEEGFPEPTLANERVNAITLKPFGQPAHVFGFGEWDHQRNINYYPCQSEKELLTKFIKVWRELSPDCITGWNVETFDIAYLCNRIDKLFGEGEHKKLSPWGLSDTREWNFMGGTNVQQSWKLHGITVLDYLQIYKKFTYKNQESYRLDNIAQVELGEGKLDYEQASLHLLYKQDYIKFLEYNIKDVDLVERLDKKLGLINLIFAMTYTAKCNYGDTFGQVRYWETIIYNFLRDRNIQTPPPALKTGNDKKGPIVGAYVKDPQVGGHDWVLSFDLNSLYPHLIMQYNMSPETLTDDHEDVTVKKLLNEEYDSTYIKRKDVTVVPNGAVFSKKKQGFLPELMEQFYDERKMWKKRMIEASRRLQTETDPKIKEELQSTITICNNNQMVRKISLNSAYGALANQYFAFFNLRIAEGITTAGQLSIQWIEKKINDWLNNLLGTNNDYVIAMDTDSIYVRFDELIKKVNPKNPIDFLDKMAKEKVEPFINKSYEELAEYVNAYEQKMQMAREVIADKGIWTAKKRYILNVYDNEGVRLAQPKLKMMGIETAKSSTPLWVRRRLEEGLKVVMQGNESAIHDFVEESRTLFKQLPPEEVAFPRGVKNLMQYKDNANIYTKSTPIHVRGSLLYNHYLVKNGLEMRYSLIKNGEKIKFCYLKLPNTINENVIAFIDFLPKEFDLHKYVDYELQFQKTFVEPLQAILDTIDWSVEPTASLDSFFA